jgi:type VI secretion system secreted protein Hcp
MGRKLTLTAVLALAVLAGATTYAWAAHTTTSTQTVNACVGPDGKLQLAAADGTCKKGDTPLSWNTVGPSGASGATGAVGATGATGADGPAGPAGSSAPTPDAVTATLLVHGQQSGDFGQDPIDVTGLLHEIVSPRDPASGLPTGKRQHKPITLTTAWGRSTPLLINALVTNENLTSVLIGLLRDGQQVATIKLTNANVAQYDQHGDDVTFQFTYQKIEWTWLDGGIVTEDDWEAPVS